ncbi:transglycosylase SLT domain-containing protein [Bradyrhizobium roseum]|nr:transglycosylase SLT domain-containing protein [Bradyrhizobium roseus]WKA26119.1 transglycosylase SLT domain-containing protein [Bradyrhizobium roseus]
MSIWATIALVILSGGALAETVSTSFDARFTAVDTLDRPAPVQPAAFASAPNKSNRATLPAPTVATDARSRFRALIEKEAARTGLPSEIAEAVMSVESGFNPGAIGGVGEIGLMQILPSTARMLGFNGTLAELAVPETNIHYGVTYLAKAWRLAGGDICTATMKYRAGHGETRFSHLSVNYCLAVRSRLAARGFQVSGTVPVATFGEPGRSGGPVSCGRKCAGLARIGTVNIAALNTRLSALVVQARAGR